jgi:hypothetical protein
MLNKNTSFMLAVAACALMASALLARTAAADTLVLADGSRLNGEVVRQEGGSLEFSTPYAGVISVQWAQVVEVMTDKPMELFLGNKELLTTQRITRSADGLSVETASGPRQLVDADLAYINPEKWQRGEGYRLAGRVNLGLDFQDGNTDKEELGLDGELKVRRQHDRLNIAGQFEKDKSAGVTTSENWLLRNKYDYFITDKWYYGGALNFESDEFADLDLRTSFGPHVGYQFFESKALNLSVDASILYVIEDFIVAPDDEYSALGWTVDFDKLVFGERFQVYHRHNGALQIGDSENLVVNTWTGLRFPLYAGVLASTEVQADYDGGAPAGVDKVDTIYRLKLGYQF